MWKTSRDIPSSKHDKKPTHRKQNYGDETQNERFDRVNLVIKISKKWRLINARRIRNKDAGLAGVVT